MMLIAYFDDSNTSRDQKVAVVAGYLGSVSQWEKFSPKWKMLLDQFGVKVLRRSKLQALQGDYSGWSIKQRERFVQKAYELANRFSYTPIGAAVATEDFRAIAPEEFKKKIGGVYGWCANICEHHVMEWCNSHNYKDKVQFVFENGTYGRGQVKEYFRAISRTKDSRRLHRYGGVSFRSKDVMPLQAADLVAYDLARIALDLRLNRRRPEVIDNYGRYIYVKSEATKWFKYWDNDLLKYFFDNSKWEETI